MLDAPVPFAFRGSESGQMNHDRHVTESKRSAPPQVPVGSLGTMQSDITSSKSIASESSYYHLSFLPICQRTIKYDVRGRCFRGVTN